MLRIATAVTGVFVENTYFLVDESTGEGAIIDPGQGAIRHLEKLGLQHVMWKSIFITHAHFDHIMGLRAFKEQFDVQVFLHQADWDLYQQFPKEVAQYGYREEALPKPDCFWEDGDQVRIGASSLEVLHTPGHTPGSVSLVGEEKVFTGDTLLFRSVGSANNLEALDALQHSLTYKLLSLPEGHVIYPGHLKQSTIGAEKQFNLNLD